MRETTRKEAQQKICVDIEELKNALCCGRGVAEEIGRKSGAEFKVGRRRFYNVGKIQKYVDELADAYN